MSDYTQPELPPYINFAMIFSVLFWLAVLGFMLWLAVEGP